MSFQVARPDGAIIKVPLAETYSDTILEAVNGYKTGKRVRLHASGLFDRERRLKGIQVVDRVNVIDPLDVRARIEELKLLRDGWLDGSGVAATASSIDRVGAQFEGRYPDDLRPPYLFLTPEGHLLAEWSLKPWSLMSEIDCHAMIGEWHALNLETDAETERELDLTSEADWAWVADQVRSAGGDAE